MGMVSLLAGVQLKTRLSCAFAANANKQASSAAETEICFIHEVFAVSKRGHSQFRRRRLRKYLKDLAHSKYLHPASGSLGATLANTKHRIQHELKGDCAERTAIGFA